jgi:signal transduction histidine kinase
MRFLLVSAFLFLCFWSEAQTGLPQSRTYANEQAELGRSVWALTQDKRGVIYLATDRGVIEYDGIRFTRLDTPPAFGIITDSAGIIYVSTKSDLGILASDARGVIHFKSLYHFQEAPVKFEDVNLIISKRKVCAVSYNVALEYDRKTNTASVYYPEKRKVFSNGFLQHDTLFVSVITRGLCYIINGKIVQAPYGDRFKSLHNGKMNCNLPLRAGERLLVFGPYIMKYFGKASPPEPFLLNGDFMRDSYLYSSFSFSDEYKIITTLNKGAVLFDTSRTIMNVYDDSRRLPGNTIANAHRDPSDNIWFAFESVRTPLVKTEMGHDISVWNKYSGIDGIVLSVMQLKGYTHVATARNFYKIDSEDRVTRYFPANPYSANSWIDFKNGSTERLVAVLNDLDIGEYKEGKFSPVFIGQDWCVISQSKRYPSRLYVCDGEKFGYLALTKNTWKFHELARIAGYRTFVEDNTGVIWVNGISNQSLLRIVPPSSDEIDRGAITSFPSGAGYTAMLFGDQVLFKTTKEFFSFNDTRKAFEPWRGAGKKFRDLLLRSSHFVKDSVNDILYLAIDGKVISVTTRRDTVYLDKPYRRFENVGDINSLSVDNHGVLWVGGIDGLIKYDRTKDHKNYNLDFHCLIRSVVNGKDSVLFGGGLGDQEIKDLKIVLGHNYDQLKITFAAPFFDKEEETLYSYQLVGRDSQWSDWDRAAAKEYNDLYEGHYTFRVKARNIYGKESSIASIPFSIHPPWFRQWWAYVLGLIGLGLLILGAITWRTRSLYAAKKELENLVTIRTNQLERANGELKSSHQQLTETNKNLEASQEELRQGNEELGAINEYLKRMQKQMVASEKMASLGQLTAGIAHEINNPINFISGGVQALEQIQNEILNEPGTLAPEARDLRKQEIKDLMKSINNGVARTANIIKSLRIFSSPVESIDDFGNVDVKECVEGAATLVASKLVDNNVNLIRNYGHHSGAKANASQISQVVINLFDNAIYAIRKNTTARIIEVTTTETATEIIIKVKDNGSGIPEVARDHIFEPFFTTKGVGTGTGLGLSICYSIIEKHKGEISFVTTMGVGTEFTITLPRGASLAKH